MKDHSESAPVGLWVELGQQISNFLRATFLPLLTILRLTIIFLAFLFADSIVLTAIHWSFSDTINEISFVNSTFLGLKMFSVIGTAVYYIVLTATQVIKDVVESSEDVRKTLKNRDI